MKRQIYIGFFLLLLFDTMGQVGFKIAAEVTAPATFDIAWTLRVFQEPWIYFAVVGYIGAFLSWMTILNEAPVGPAFAASHLEIVTVLLVSVLFMEEQFTALQLLGTLAIVGGVLLLAATEKPEST